MRSKRAIVRSACSFTSLFQGLLVGRTNRNGSRKASSIGPCRACVLCSPRSGPFLAIFQAPLFLSSVISGPAFTFSVWPSILISRTCSVSCRTRRVRVLRFDVVGSAVVGALRVHFRALVLFLETVERNPVAAVVARGVSQEADVIGRNLALVAVLFEERVKPLTDERAGSVTCFLHGRSR